MDVLFVSDHEREYTVGLLNEHHMSGRLTEDEFEERVAEAWRARTSQDLWTALRSLPVDPPPAPVVAAPAPAGPGNGQAVTALVFGLVGLLMLLITLGFGFVLTLPAGIVAWVLGRGALRDGTGAPRVAKAGLVLGIVTTVCSLIVLAGCAAVITVGVSAG